jgi:hypothetical protein
MGSLLAKKEEYKMVNEFAKGLSKEYCPRFVKIAVEKGFVTEEQVKEALSHQKDDDSFNRRYRLIGQIFFEKGWMTFQQIDLVLIELSKNEKMKKDASWKEDVPGESLLV